MEKRISQKNKKKFGLLVSSLDNVENIVPNQLKTVFNFKGRKSPINHHYPIWSEQHYIIQLSYHYCCFHL